MSQPAENDLREREPEGPWFVNVTHLRVAGRPLCCSPVDYERVMWSEDWSSVDCAACHRARPIPPAWDDDPNHPEGVDCHGEPLSSGERCGRSEHRVFSPERMRDEED